MGGESCTVLRLRLMRKLAMSRMRDMAGSRSRKSQLLKEKIGFLRGAAASEGGGATFKNNLLILRGWQN